MAPTKLLAFLALLDLASAKSIRGRARGAARACSKQEAELEFLRRATGDKALLQLGPPNCLITSFTDEETRLEPELLLQHGQRRLAANASEKLVHLVVHQSNAGWCPPPCQSATWELGIPKDKRRGRWGDSDDYTVYEIAIWQQLGKITAYQFDAAWYKTAKNAYFDLCGGTGWACPSYMAHREVMAVTSCPTQFIKKDYEEDSASMAKKMGAMMDCLRKKAGGGRAVLSYVGHGSDADGSLFESAISQKEGKALVAKQDFAALNFGTNCEEGRWGMVSAFQTGSEEQRLILASDLEVGGYPNHLSRDMGNLLLAAKSKLNFMSAVQTGLVEAMAAPSFPQGLRQQFERVVANRADFYSKIAPILKQNNLHQSLSLYDAGQAFPALVGELRRVYKAASKEQILEALAKAKKDCCDVRQFLRALGDDAKAVTAFKTFRASYASSRAVGIDPEIETFGFAFDIIGDASTDPHHVSPQWMLDLGIGTKPGPGVLNHTRQQSLLGRRTEADEAPPCADWWGDAYTCDLGVLAQATVPAAPAAPAAPVAPTDRPLRR